MTVIQKELKHENYENILFNSEQKYHEMKTIRSENHQLESYEINEVSLSCFDDKRIFMMMVLLTLHMDIIKQKHDLQGHAGVDARGKAFNFVFPFCNILVFQYSNLGIRHFEFAEGCSHFHFIIS